MSDQREQLNEMKKFMSIAEDSNGRPYICVHAKKGKYECTATSSYGAAKKAAEHWKLKSTAGIDAHLADVKHSTQFVGENDAEGKEFIDDYESKTADNNPCMYCDGGDESCEVCHGKDEMFEDPGHSIVDIVGEEGFAQLLRDLDVDGDLNTKQEYWQRLYDHYGEDMPYGVRTGDEGTDDQYIGDKVSDDYGDEIEAAISQQLSKDRGYGGWEVKEPVTETVGGQVKYKYVYNGANGNKTYIGVSYTEGDAIPKIALWGEDRMRHAIANIMFMRNGSKQFLTDLFKEEVMNAFFDSVTDEPYVADSDEVLDAIRDATRLGTDIVEVEDEVVREGKKPEYEITDDDVEKDRDIFGADDDDFDDGDSDDLDYMMNENFNLDAIVESILQESPSQPNETKKEMEARWAKEESQRKVNYPKNVELIKAAHKKLLDKGYEYLYSKVRPTWMDGEESEHYYLSPNHNHTKIMSYDSYGVHGNKLKIEYRVEKLQKDKMFKEDFDQRVVELATEALDGQPKDYYDPEDDLGPAARGKSDLLKAAGATDMPMSDFENDYIDSEIEDEELGLRFD